MIAAITRFFLLWLLIPLRKLVHVVQSSNYSSSGMLWSTPPYPPLEDTTVLMRLTGSWTSSCATSLNSRSPPSLHLAINRAASSFVILTFTLITSFSCTLLAYPLFSKFFLASSSLIAKQLPPFFNFFGDIFLLNSSLYIKFVPLLPLVPFLVSYSMLFK